MTRRVALPLLAVLSVGAASAAHPAAAASPPKVGDAAPDFELATAAGQAVKLSDLTASGPVVLVVLRGYPGYQCPLCSRQVTDFVARADDFRKAGAGVAFVYPGPAAGLTDKANELSAGNKLPDHFRLLVDPGYEFTNRYGLRWDAPQETAYPSTFVVGPGGEVTFAQVSKGHGGRVPAATAAAAAAKAKAKAVK